jgi:hypothetical protein
MFMPLLGVGAQVALQFGIVESLKKVAKKNFGELDGTLHWKYSFLCGTAAGLPSALVVVQPLLCRRYWITPDSECS